MAEITPTLAEEIINEAKSYNSFEGPIPESDEKRVAEAKTLVAQAAAAYRAGAKGDAVISILKLSEYTGEERLEISRSHVEEYEVEQNGVVHRNVPETDNLPVPPEIEGQPPKFIEDFSAISDKQLRKLHSEFNACSARASWLCSQSENQEDVAKEAYQKAWDEVMISTSSANGDGKRLKDEILAEVNRNQSVSEAKENHIAWKLEVRKYKTLTHIYDRMCDRLSREFTIRDSERGHS